MDWRAMLLGEWFPLWLLLKDVFSEFAENVENGGPDVAWTVEGHESPTSLPIFHAGVVINRDDITGRLGFDDLSVQLRVELIESDGDTFEAAVECEVTNFEGVVVARMAGVRLRLSCRRVAVQDFTRYTQRLKEFLRNSVDMSRRQIDAIGTGDAADSPGRSGRYTRRLEGLTTNLLIDRARRMTSVMRTRGDSVRLDYTWSYGGPYAELTFRARRGTVRIRCSEEASVMWLDVTQVFDAGVQWEKVKREILVSRQVDDLLAEAFRQVDDLGGPEDAGASWYLFGSG